MAHTHRPFYNIDKAVGKFQTNTPDDVMLVQFFLSELANVHTIFQWDKPATLLKVNGVPDDNLFAWIRSYQVALKPGSPITIDGIVNPINGPITQRTTHTHTFYTIMFLNNHFESVFPKRFSNLPHDLTLPIPLQKALQRSV